MSPELIDQYQSLVDTALDHLPEDWHAFTLTAERSASGTALSLEYSTQGLQNQELSPVPFALFGIIENVARLMGPSQTWTKMVFQFDSNQDYKVNFVYASKPQA